MLVMQTRYIKVVDYFSCFWRTERSSVGRIDLGGSRDTHRIKRAYESSKIKVIRMLLNWDQRVDLVVLITIVQLVHQSKLV